MPRTQPRSPQAPRAAPKTSAPPTTSAPKASWAAKGKGPADSPPPGGKAGWASTSKPPAGAPPTTAQGRKPPRVATIADPPYVNPPKPYGPENGKPSGPFKTYQSTTAAGTSANYDAFSHQTEVGGGVHGKYGNAMYQAGTKTNVGGNVGANGSLSYDGLHLRAGGQGGADTSVYAGGHMTSKPMMMGDVPVTGRLGATATAGAGLGAHASASAQFAPYPPTAFVEGRAGAFAGAKIGTNYTVGAGPFTMAGNVTANAGLGALASANAGYKDGIVRFGAQAMVSPLLGVGAGFQTSVNTAQLGQMANNFIDNPTGRPQPDLWDQAAARQQMQQAHAGYYQNVANWVEGGSW